MWEEEEQYGQEQYADPMQQQQCMMEPQIDPYELEQIRYEVELAHEEFQRLMNGRPRLYSRFR